MVLCWIALPIFAILGIFSAKYRKLTKESLECLFKTATFRKCSSGLDDKIKSQISGKLLKFSPSSAKLFYKHYKIISLILLIIFAWSTIVSAQAIYNYAVHGNCNGPGLDAVCIIDEIGKENNALLCLVKEKFQSLKDSFLGIFGYDFIIPFENVQL